MDFRILCTPFRRRVVLFKALRRTSRGFPEVVRPVDPRGGVYLLDVGVEMETRVP